MSSRGVDRSRFDGYLERLSEVLGHADRRWPLEAYLTGLLLPGHRKSVEPMAAKIDPRHISRAHQAMHHFVSTAPWDEGPVLAVARDYALTQLERHAPVGAWVIDDTGIPKKGNHSVGVAWQYCGALGKPANCQVAVSLSLANKTMSVPAAWRLYLPEKWAQERDRRARAGVPEHVGFVKKWEIALEEIDRLLAEDLPPAPIVADAGYGNIADFRDGIVEWSLSYAVGIQTTTPVWRPGKEPLSTTGGGGLAHPRLVSLEELPVSVRELALSLPKTAWKTLRWREGTKGTMTSRFASMRVQAVHGSASVRRTEWLLAEWPVSEKEPTKYWLSSVPEHVELDELVALAKIRWRIERDYQELKDELGLDHYEGRGWRGFHHHGVLCMAAYCFLAAERGRLSPPQAVAYLRPATLPKGFKTRGSARATRKT